LDTKLCTQHKQLVPSTTSSLAALESQTSIQHQKDFFRNTHVVSLSFTAAVPRVTRAPSSETDAVLPHASAWDSFDCSFELVFFLTFTLPEFRSR
jgi:hypothetical protein